MLVNFQAIWPILLLFGIFYGHLVYFVVILVVFKFWYVVPRKIWQPWLGVFFTIGRPDNQYQIGPPFVANFSREN
jgi:hypothetical protein